MTRQKRGYRTQKLMVFSRVESHGTKIVHDALASDSYVCTISVDKDRERMKRQI